MKVQFTLNIDDRIVSFIKRRLVRRALGLVLLLALPSTVVVYAASVPNNFVDGDIASASQVNANFAALTGAVTTLEGTAWSGGGTTRYFSGGKVGVGTANPTEALEVLGQVKSTGAFGEAGIAAFTYTNDSGYGYVGPSSGTAVNGAGMTLGGPSSQYPGQIRFNTPDRPAGPAMTIASNGNVGIGTSSPGAQLHIGGAGTALRFGTAGTASGDSTIEWKRPADTHAFAYFYAGGGAGLSDIRFSTRRDTFTTDTEPTEAMRIQGATGNLGIGTNSPASRLDLAGGCMTGTTCSDRSLKTDIRPLPSDRSALAKVLAMQGTTFQWRSQRGKRAIGLIAQEVEKVAPEVVSTSPTDGQKGISCTGVEALLVEAIKAQQREIEELRASLRPSHSGRR
jgi:hypothetical protein